VTAKPTVLSLLTTQTSFFLLFPKKGEQE